MKKLQLNHEHQKMLVETLERGNPKGYNIRELRQVNSIIDQIQNHTSGEQVSLEDAEFQLLSRVWSQVQFLGQAPARKAALEIDEAIAEAKG